MQLQINVPFTHLYLLHFITFYLFSGRDTQQIKMEKNQIPFTSGLLSGSAISDVTVIFRIILFLKNLGRVHDKS